MALPPASAAAAAPGMMPPDPTMGAGAPPPAPADTDDDVVVTISKTGDGSYMVYAGDEPDAGSADMSGDDAGAMGAAGDAAAPGGGMGGGGGAGKPASSIGEALKLAMDLLQADASSAGAPGTADDQLSAGYSGDKNPTPAKGSPAQKY